MDEIALWCLIGAIIIAFLVLFFYSNLPTKITIGGVYPTLDFMEKAKLVLIRDEARIDLEEKVEATKLLSEKPTLVIVVRRPGCPLCRRHAAQMSNVLPEVEAAGMQMIAVVHEPRGVNRFKKFFKGNVFYDDERRFYGEKQRWLPLWIGFLRINTYTRLLATFFSGYGGNLRGEGRLLGGVYLVINGKMAWSHPEKDWGDTPDEKKIRDAIKICLGPRAKSV